MGLIPKWQYAAKESFGKRVADIIVSGAGMIVFSPIFAVAAIAIWIEDGRPLLYAQERVGQHGRIFKLLKFRSMRKDAEQQSGPVFSSTNDRRITRVGKILRATAMDELPQLWNIFKGDMSLVGPRSERPCFVMQFKQSIPSYDKRHQVRPGLTGMAQVFGRYNTDARNKLRYDKLTIKHQGGGQTLKLIFVSFRISLRGKWTAMSKER